MTSSIKRFSLLFSLFVIAFYSLRFSSNPPIDRTNRAGSNCTGCHAGSLNPSGGSVNLSGLNQYYPGRTYNLSLNQTGGSTYGFEMTSVRNSNTNTGAGSFSSSTGIGVSVQEWQIICLSFTKKKFWFLDNLVDRSNNERRGHYFLFSRCFSKWNWWKFGEIKPTLKH